MNEIILQHLRQMIAKKDDVKKYKRIIRNFFNYIEWPDAPRHDILMTITNIELRYLKKEGLELIITTHRPGNIIGVGGKTWNELEKEFKEMAPEITKLTLKESDLWK